MLPAAMSMASPGNTAAGTGDLRQFEIQPVPCMMPALLRPAGMHGRGSLTSTNGRDHIND